jgi:adenosine deaminase
MGVEFHCFQNISAMKNKNISLIFQLILLSVITPTIVWGQADSARVSAYFEQIRQDENRLRQFFAEMPKGGDLHNHMTGSVYAETYFDLATQDSLWVDMADGHLYMPKDSAKGKEMVRLTPNMPNLHNIRMMLIDKWSIRNFDPGKFSLGADEYFFGTFGLFNAVAGRHNVELMRELRKRADREKVQYLEVMLTSPGINRALIDNLCGSGFFNKYNEQLENAIRREPEKTEKILSGIFKEWNNASGMNSWVNKYVAYIDSIDRESTLPSGYANAPVCFYQGYASRNSDPLVVFAQLYVSFKGCLQKGSKLVGVNIVSAENGETSMEDYTAHMKMFRYLNKVLGGKVNTSLHAGELTLGLVKPENMNSHIREAVFVAGAKRIGHGVDVAFESNSTSLLDEMRKRQVVIEINLTSNEFILGVKNDAHPFMLYRQAGVPIVISTDDPGILRTNLTQQYVLLTLRYGIGYYEIKQLVRNSIRFGFMPDVQKRMLLDKLENSFATFEQNWSKNIKTIQNWKSK